MADALMRSFPSRPSRIMSAVWDRAGWAPSAVSDIHGEAAGQSYYTVPSFPLIWHGRNHSTIHTSKSRRVLCCQHTDNHVFNSKFRLCKLLLLFFSFLSSPHFPRNQHQHHTLLPIFLGGFERHCTVYSSSILSASLTFSVPPSNSRSLHSFILFVPSVHLSRALASLPHRLAYHSSHHQSSCSPIVPLHSSCPFSWPPAKHPS